MITRDIKDLTLRKLQMIQRLVSGGNAVEADYQLSDLIDSISSSAVSVVYSREKSTTRPGDCENAGELASRNID